ncbi:MAG: hypothetical protein KC476_02250 [Cyanobacteria bacterium HKST-UBA06]|nr:hypothetical protein [Cyanobacteria bacterium HKST-UBA06]
MSSPVSTAMSDAMRTASNGLQMAQGQLNTAAVGLAEATLPMQPETAPQPDAEYAQLQGRTTTVYPLTSFSSVVNQLIFAQAASVAIMANAAVVRATYESSDEVQRIVSRAQSTHQYRQQYA